MDAIIISLTDVSVLKDGLVRIAIRVGNLYFMFIIFPHFIYCKENAVLSMHNFEFSKSDIY